MMESWDSVDEQEQETRGEEESPFSGPPPAEPDVPPSSSSETSASGSESESTDDEQPSEPETHDTPTEQGGGTLAGTSSEIEHGVGGVGDHPAPAMMRGPDGELHSAGQPPAGNGASEVTPTGDGFDVPDEAHALSAEARAELNQVHEPEQAETDRPDLGTPGGE